MSLPIHPHSFEPDLCARDLWLVGLDLGVEEGDARDKGAVVYLLPWALALGKHCREQPRPWLELLSGGLVGHLPLVKSNEGATNRRCRSTLMISSLVLSGGLAGRLPRDDHFAGPRRENMCWNGDVARWS